jgi:hypothetical protein
MRVNFTIAITMAAMIAIFFSSKIEAIVLYMPGQKVDPLSASQIGRFSIGRIM